ncbi:MAG: hypothetical protein GF411_16625 [Candidatus Lokiarchaeota archaeon]|nr:hypothetical protein [Candidatus Lokiarchaeota archaeon]
MTHKTTQFIDREGRKIILTRGEVKHSFPLSPIPNDLLNDLLNISFSDEESVNAQKLIEGNMLHKPIVCTRNVSHPFIINVAPKIARITLRDEVIQDRLEELEGKFLSFQGRSYSTTQSERHQLYHELFLTHSEIDPVRFGAVEMYGANTYSNILDDPRVTLCFSWYRPQTEEFLAYHINCIAEIVPPSDPFYKFMRILRTLFSTTFLELGKPEYICAYKLWISETKEKTLTDKTGFTE